MNETEQTNTTNVVNRGAKLLFILSKIVGVFNYIVSVGWIFMSIIPTIFCDSGPVSVCYFSSGFIFLSGIAGIILTIFLNKFISKRKETMSFSIFLLSLALLFGLVFVLPILQILLSEIFK